jgi:serine/threonine protein phosphatase PrpC
VALLTEDHHDGSGLTRWLPDAADPEQVTLILQPGEQLVLCTDGITDVLSDTEIADIVAGALVAEALDAGANDNCTAVVYTHGGAP